MCSLMMLIAIRAHSQYNLAITGDSSNYKPIASEFSLNQRSLVGKSRFQFTRNYFFSHHHWTEDV